MASSDCMSYCSLAAGNRVNRLGKYRGMNLQSSSGVPRNPDMSVMGAVRIKERRSSQKYLVVTKPLECAD